MQRRGFLFLMILVSMSACNSLYSMDIRAILGGVAGADRGVGLLVSDIEFRKKQLENLEKDVKYYVYPNADHNLRPNWDTVVSRDLEFFNSN